MDKKIIWTTVIISIVMVILGYIVIDSLSKKKTPVNLPAKNSLVLYYGLTCPHCKEVEEWMKKNKVEEKIKVDKKEVWYNKENAAELQEVARVCNLDSSSIGVPFLWADGKCYIGTPDVEKVLTDKLKMKK